MKLTTMMAAGLLVFTAGGDYAWSIQPPLERPSPPPCCADGVCRPNTDTYGWYATRWRRWPCEELQPIPAGSGASPGAGLTPDIQPFETPRVEDEDRRAPPPSKKAAEKAAEEHEGKSATPPAESAGPGIPPGTGLPPLPIGPGAPAGPDGGGTEKPATTPWDSPATPGGQGVPSMPWDKKPDPTGEMDPPPAPPIATSPMNARPSAQPVGRPKQAPARTPSARTQISSHGDPPPTLPLALSGGPY